jgi:exodeoxyribonuclease-5
MIALRPKDADGLFPQQREAITKLTEWFASDTIEFILKGYAGTGKTHVISTFLKIISKRALCCVTAPTHKALHVIERQVGVKGKTLHSLHGLRMNVDLLNFDIENPQFDPLGIQHIQNYKLVVIDEASMINADLFDFTREACIRYKTKVIYVGDPLQLPPVNEMVGKAFTDVREGFNLTEIIRQDKDHDLVELFVMLRDDIINRTNNCITHLIMSRDRKVAEDYQVLSKVNYNKEIIKYFGDEKYTQNIDYIRQACYTRNAATRWNNYIRAHIIGHDVEILTIHDVLTAYTNQVDTFKTPIISNSDDYILLDIDKYVDNFGISTYSVNLQNVIDRKRSPKLLILDYTNPVGVEKMTQLLNFLHHEAAIKRIPGGFKKYYNFKNSILLMKSIELSEANNKKIVVKDIDYAYALTIHKLQGSTIENVAVDLRDIIYPTENVNRPNDVDTRNRLLYVALSRATNHAIIHY